MNELSPTARSSRLFGSALACGMLMGVLCGGFEVLFQRFFWPVSRFSSRFEIYSRIFFMSWASTSLLLMAAGLYQRSLPNALRALVYGLAVTFIHIPSQWATNDAMFAFLRAAGPEWHSLFYFFAWTVLPNILSVLTLGMASAALFGFPKQRSRFLLSASFASALFIVQGAVFRVLPWENDGEMQVISSMASLVGGLIWGVALAWPVERLEREKLLAKERAI